MSSFSLSGRRSYVCFTVSNGGETNVMSSFSLSVRRSSVCFTVSNGENQTSCHHSHCTDNENDDMKFVSLPIRDSKTYRRTTYRQ
jgi:hypothetical protein